jgi:endo-1,4-beta-xylanase
VAEWDVLNEPVDDDGKLTRNVFFEALGERYIDVALRAAREADPQARLFINEQGAEVPGPKGFAMFSLVRRLQARGVPLDGIGFQNHTAARGYPSRAQLEGTLEAYAGLGLATAVTEMDVVVRRGSDLAEQAEAYGAAADACLAVRSCTGFTVWGVTDRYSWRGPQRRPLLFDVAGAPKPALTAVVQRFLR